MNYLVLFFCILLAIPVISEKIAYHLVNVIVNNKERANIVSKIVLYINLIIVSYAVTRVVFPERILIQYIPFAVVAITFLMGIFRSQIFSKRVNLQMLYFTALKVPIRVLWMFYIGMFVLGLILRIISYIFI